MKNIKLILCAAAWILFPDTTYGQSETLYKASIEIAKTQQQNEIKKKDNDFYANIREQLIQKDSLNFVSATDTVFFLETYDYESGITCGLIFNQRKSVSYEYLADQFRFDHPTVFDRETIELVKRWNIATLRRYEDDYATLINPFLIFASRVIIEKNKVVRADCIEFEEFYRLSRIDK